MILNVKTSKINKKIFNKKHLKIKTSLKYLRIINTNKTNNSIKKKIYIKNTTKIIYINITIKNILKL